MLRRFSYHVLSHCFSILFLFYSMILHSTLFYFILLYSILFYSCYPVISYCCVVRSYLKQEFILFLFTLSNPLSLKLYSMQSHNSILSYTILFYFVLSYTILFYLILSYTILYYLILSCTILYYLILSYTIL